MFKAVRFGKIRLREGFEELPWADVFKLNEDFLTAAVFSRLLYVDPEVFSALLLPEFDSTLGRVQEATFWPTWSVQSKKGERTRVEPDLCIEFENLDLIVEAKLNDQSSCQMADQWAREWAAWHQKESVRPGKQALFLGVGGFSTNNAIKASVTAIGDAANCLLQVEFPGVPPIRVAGLSWQDLYYRLTAESLENQLSSQLAQDLREILSYFGLRHYQYLEDLVGVTRRLAISPMGPDVVARWHTPKHEQDWIEASRRWRPISGSSIGLFGRSLHGELR